MSHQSATIPRPDSAASTKLGAAKPDPLRGALIDSRQRWRDLVTIAADLAFETDPYGRFVFLTPDPALGWSVSTLIGQPSSLLLADSGPVSGFNPFRTTVEVRRKRVWIKRGDGGIACVAFAAAPLRDAEGTIAGARGLGVDLTEYDLQGAQIAAALRRGEVLDHILWRMGQSVLAPQMMRSALEALMNALGAEGAAVIALPGQGRPAVLAHHIGNGAEAVLRSAGTLLERHADIPPHLNDRSGRSVILTACHPRFGESAVLSIWRPGTSRLWDSEDRTLIDSAANIVRMVLEHETIQQEMARQARTDPLTGLLNRRAFLEEVERDAERLDREALPGTLMFTDLDHFKPVNDRLGHETGDRVLVRTAELLRGIVRPFDLVARLGGDEFAIWLSGADHMTAAERAEQLGTIVPNELRTVVGEDSLPLSMSIGIATREAASKEPVDSVIRRADLAMYDVKRNGRGHWRVARQATP